MQDVKFWMVWNPNRRVPTYRHATEHGATQEAERLAALNPGERFYVLVALRAREVNNMHRIELADQSDGLPF